LKKHCDPSESLVRVVSFSSIWVGLLLLENAKLDTEMLLTWY